jgi:sarcosine oxidase
MAERWDAIVIGGGAMGTSAARHLAARGRRTLLLERFRLGHSNGSSHGPNRIFRLAYHHPDYVRMARLALEEWRALEHEAGEPLLDTTGGLDVGPGAAIAAEALGAAGEPFEWLTGQAARDRWPAFRAPEESLLFQGSAGVCRADATLAAQTALATAAGATVMGEIAVTALAPVNDGVEVRTADGERHEAAVAVVTAGAWAQPLLATAGIELPLRVTREVVAYAGLPQPGPLPTLIDWTTPDSGPRYALPVTGTTGAPYRGSATTVKMGVHQAGAAVDPDPAAAGDPPATDDALARFASERFGSEGLTGLETCLYTNTADEDFVLDRVGPVVIGSPCSGHGFKFTPLVGRILADLATGARPPVPLGRFAWDRPSLRRDRP